MADKRVWMKPWVFYPVVIAAIVFVVIAWWFCWYYPVTTILVVRHAEKTAAPPADPPLSAAGQARAQTLVEVAGKAGVTVIYATQFMRTQQTAQPLANHLGVTVNVFNVTGNAQQYAEDLVDQILSQHSGEVVFIVNHSNTVPLIIEELGANPIPPINEDEYDNLFILTMPSFFGATKIIKAKYGAPH